MCNSIDSLQRGISCGGNPGYTAQLQDFYARLEKMRHQYGMEERDVISDLIYIAVAKDIVRLIDRVE